MLYVVYFEIHIKQTSDFAQGNKPNSYQTSEKKVPDPPHVMVIRIHKTKLFACGIWNPAYLCLWNCGISNSENSA